MVDATQWGANQKIRLTMQPTRPSLSDTQRVLDIPNDPAAEKWDGTSSHRRVITPDSEHGLVSIMGPKGLFYANTVGTFGVDSDGQNWGRLASAAHRWPLKLVGKRKVSLLLFSDDTLFLAEMRSSKNHFINSLFLMILGYHFSEKKFWVGNELARLGFSIDISAN